MYLTRAEYSSFNIRSKLQLLQNDGNFLAERKVYRTHLIKLYKIYSFYVEVIRETGQDKVLNADPIINPGMLKLYNFIQDEGEGER